MNTEMITIEVDIYNSRVQQLGLSYENSQCSSPCLHSINSLLPSSLITTIQSQKLANRLSKITISCHTYICPSILPKHGLFIFFLFFFLQQSLNIIIILGTFYSAFASMIFNFIYIWTSIELFEKKYILLIVSLFFLSSSSSVTMCSQYLGSSSFLDFLIFPFSDNAFFLFLFHFRVIKKYGGGG